MKYQILCFALFPAIFICPNVHAFELSNGKIITQSHFISNAMNASYVETNPVHAMGTSLGAQADTLKIATGYSYHTTTNHSVYIINDTQSIQTYYWYFNSCPEHFGCITWGGEISLNPGGSFCESGTLKPNVIYGQIGIYQNKAITQTSGYDPKYIESIAPIQVS